MKKFFNLVLANICIMVFLSSCGKTGTDKTSSLSHNTGISSSSGTTTSDGNSKNEITNKQEEPAKTPDTTEKPSAKTTEEPEEEKNIIKATIDTETGYSDNKRQINVIGFKSYKKLESKLYKDKAAKNKEFLVLFLEINNKQNDNDYINVNYLTAKVDGKKITNKVLFNDPEDFKTIFQNAQPGNALRGFVAWEVPENWKKIKVVYNGWKDSDHLSLNCTFTPDDYFDPLKYNS